MRQAPVCANLDGPDGGRRVDDDLVLLLGVGRNGQEREPIAAKLVDTETLGVHLYGPQHCEV